MKDKKTPWVTTTNRYVAFLDIMGFKDMVARMSHKEIYEKLNAINDAQSQISFDDVYITKFSDSIVIFSRNEYSLISFRAVVNYIFVNCIINAIPIKGAIAFGEISVNKSKAIFFGQPLIDAYLLEEDLHYYGIACHHSAEVKMKEDERNLFLSNYFEKLTPFKSGMINHINLNWFKYAIEDYYWDNTDSKYRIRNYITDLYRNVSGAPRKYIDNTLKMFDEIII